MDPVLDGTAFQHLMLTQRALVISLGLTKLDGDVAYPLQQEGQDVITSQCRPKICVTPSSTLLEITLLSVKRGRGVSGGVMQSPRHWQAHADQQVPQQGVPEGSVETGAVLDIVSEGSAWISDASIDVTVRHPCAARCMPKASVEEG